MDRSDEELDEVADELMLAVPPVEPPAGFEDRVMERLHAARKRNQTVARAPWWAVAAAAIVFLFGGGVVGAVIGRSSSNDHEALRTVQLVSTSGGDIGDVSTYSGKPTWIFMRLEGDLPDGTYRCMLEMDDGRTVPIGRLWAVNGHGGWGEHVDVDPTHARQATLLDRSGATVATARFG